MVNAQKITANTSFYMMALVIQKLLSFVYFSVLARNLGVEATGQYFFAISFATMFSVLADLGLSAILTREVAQQSDDGQRWFQQIFTLKIILAVLTAVFLLILDNLLFYGDQVRNLIYLSTLLITIDSFTLFFYAYIRGRQSLKYESWGTIIFQLLVMLLGLSLLALTHQVLLFLGVLLIASLFNFIFSALILQKRWQIKFRLLYDRIFIKNIAAIALPFALAAVFAKIYAYIDTFFLKIFLGDVEVGFYSIAYKLTFALQFIPLAFVAALYPAFANYFQNDQDALESTFIRSFHYLAFVSLPISWGIIALAPEMISAVYTKQFNFSVLPLQVLMASIPFLFINFSLSSFLNATNRQEVNTRNLGLTMVLNIILNLIFIRLFGVWGASLASALSTLFLFCLNLQAVLLVVRVRISEFAPLLKSIMAALIMFFAMGFLVSYWPWYLTIVAGILTYLILMLLTRAISRQDLFFIKNSLTKAQ